MRVRGVGRGPGRGLLVSVQRHRWQRSGLELALLISVDLPQVTSSLGASVSFSKKGPQHMLMKEGGGDPDPASYTLPDTLGASWNLLPLPCTSLLVLPIMF